MLSDFFSTCFNTELSPPSSYNHMLDSTIPEDLLCTDEDTFFLLSSLDSFKATGPDGISACMLRSTADSITPSVTELLNLSLCSGHVPMVWKRSFVVPIPESSPASSPNHYRPISLLSILIKVLECHVYNLIMDHLTVHYPLSDSQWGFQSGKSTVSLLQATTHSWLKILEEGSELSAVFFHLHKAFDSVPHQNLLVKLLQTGLIYKSACPQLDL